MKINKSKVYFTIGFVFVFFITFAQNQKIADSLIWVYENISLKDSAKLEVLRNIAFNQTDPNKKLYYSDLLIELANKKNNDLYIFRGYYQKGASYRLKGKNESAIDAYFKCVKVSQSINYKLGIGISYVAIGDVYASSENHKNSILYFNKAITILKELKDSISLASALLNIGNEYLSSNILDTALLYFDESLNIFSNKKYSTGIAYCLGNKGRIYISLRKDSLAEFSILKAINILEKLGDNYALASYKRYLAYLYRNQNKTTKALYYANQSLKIASDASLKAQMRDAYDLLAELHSSIDDYKNAYLYQSKFIAYRDSINNNETIRKIADLRTEYEVAQKQTEVDLLIKKRNITRIITVSLGLVVLLTLILLYVLYRNYCRKKALNKILLEQKEEMKTQQEQLEELNRTKDRFFSIISHDLRGPIGSIGGLPMLFREYIAMNDINELSGLIVHMDTSMQRVSNLLDNLLEWALSQQGTFPYHPENVILNNVATEVYSIFSIMAETKGIRLEEDIQEELMVVADKNSLMTIIRNLLSNAVKFTPQGGTITIAAGKQNGDAIISVSDTGVGIPEEKLKTLFKLSEKKSTWGTDHEKGLGIGLSLVHDFVLMNNGNIRVESTLGKGTTFIVKIPLSHKNA